MCVVCYESSSLGHEMYVERHSIIITQNYICASEEEKRCAFEKNNVTKNIKKPNELRNHGKKRKTSYSSRANMHGKQMNGTGCKSLG